MSRTRSRRRLSDSPRRPIRGTSRSCWRTTNSTDRTAELAEAAAARLSLDYRRVFEPEPGKFHALNRVLETIKTPLVVTLDADTYLYPDALDYLVARVTERP